MQHYQLELLSPARNLACGIAAVDHGADAVYIGAPSFGARAAAGNTLQDIEKLIKHAHLFSARVYIALNTLLVNEELEEAVHLARQLYDIGADALIIQDMGLLECALPPIPLHASTQTDNRSLEKVRFLEKVGFQQVVLARELNLEQIRAIRAGTSIVLECFIHGALCVSYSGQCYMSEVVCGRSANRGECAQFCRHKYTLKDGTGRILERDRYLLSLKDLDLSGYIRQLVAAGVRSFKIEGRLKDIGYVKNVTAFYRQLLDSIIEDNEQLTAASSGRCSFMFTPDTSKSFNRGKTEYYIDNPRNTPAALETPKSLGEAVGKVVAAGKQSFALDGAAVLHNGDGLCYFSGGGALVGMKANRVDGTTIFHRNAQSPPIGTVIYRNHDTAFEKMLAKSEQCRYLTIDVAITESEDGLQCAVIDEDGLRSWVNLTTEKQIARNPGKLTELIERQMRKVGGTVFRVNRVEVMVDHQLFLPSAIINELRRQAFSGHLRYRLSSYQRQEAVLVPNEEPWLAATATYLDNITNDRAHSFYRRHGVRKFPAAGEEVNSVADAALMTMRYCLKAQLAGCPRKADGKEPFREPLTLTDNTGIYELEFDCRRCLMILKKHGDGNNR